MAILSTVAKAGSLASTVFSIADTLFPNSITIQEANVPVPDTVIIDSTASESLNLSVSVTEKPIAPLDSNSSGGAGIDYVSRQSVPLVLTGILSTYAVNLIDNPGDSLIQYAGSFAPQVASAIQTGVGLVSNVVDLGKDEIDRKLQLLYRWQTRVVDLTVTGLRLDLNQLSSSRNFTFILESISLTSSLDTGDGVGVTLVLRSLLGSSTERFGIQKGNSILDAGAVGVDFGAGVSNPFGA